MFQEHALKVLLTIDTEIWCDGWQDIDKKFPLSFKKYIYGRTPTGDYGLPFILELLRNNGLKGVFFVEPLFACRFGLAPLEEIVGLIRSYDQAVELHLHTEWVDEARKSILLNSGYKRQHIKYFSYDEQRVLLEKGRELLLRAGAEEIRAFRAGSFGANNDTLRALAATGIYLDSSYNPVASACEIATSDTLYQATTLNDVLEVPMSTFTDGLKRQRPANITACSYAELATALLDARRKRWEHFVILTHSFELLNGGKTRRNPVVIKRFVKLCEFLSNNVDEYLTTDFKSEPFETYKRPVEALHSGFAPTLVRLAEQVWSTIQ